MFNLSGSEIIVILLLALVVLGPEKLPDAIRRFGRTYAELKKMGTGFQQEFKSAIDEPMREMRETADLLKKSADFSSTTKPVTDTVSDRPARNESLASADPDAVPADDVPFAEEGIVPTDEVTVSEVAASDAAVHDDVDMVDAAVPALTADVDVDHAGADRDDDAAEVSVGEPPDDDAHRGEANDA